MKKTATILIMLAALLFMTNGVAQVQLGLQAGANFGSFSMDPEISGVDLGSRTGLVIGGIFSYNFSPMLALQVEPAYVQKGGTMTLEETEEGMRIKMVQALDAAYLDVPVYLKVVLSDGSVQPYLLGGMYLAFLMGDAKLTVDEVTIDGVDYTSEFSDLEEEVDATSTDYGIGVGGGVIFEVGSVNLFVEALYNLGLANINDDPDDDDTTVKLSGFQIKGGVMFPLN